MKFSLNSLMTVTMFVAWFLALSQLESGARAVFVMVSLLAVLGLLVGIAMVIPRDGSGKLDHDNSPLLNALEPTFKFTFAIIVVAVLVVVLGICVASFGLLGW